MKRPPGPARGAMSVAKRRIRALLHRAGIDVARWPPKPIDFDAAFLDLLRLIRPYTMTSPERVFALRDAVRYVARNGIPGAIVECGVWRGGSMMAAAHTLLEANDITRPLFLFDTYAGMTSPTSADIRYDGVKATELMARWSDPDGPEAGRMIASIEDVRRAMSLVSYPSEHVHLIEGPVEETIPGRAPREISLLRLDTDWYESTRHELCHLFPKISPGGVLIIDDYGYFEGARRAVDEYLEQAARPVLLNRIDHTGRIAVVGSPSRSAGPTQRDKR